MAVVTDPITFFNFPIYIYRLATNAAFSNINAFIVQIVLIIEKLVNQDMESRSFYIFVPLHYN